MDETSRGRRALRSDRTHSSPSESALAHPSAAEPGNQESRSVLRTPCHRGACRARRRGPADALDRGRRTGIAAEARERVFERFARLSESRSRAGGGVGLGFAITRDIVSRHHGEIFVDPAYEAGARFRGPAPHRARTGSAWLTSAMKVRLVALLKMVARLPTSCRSREAQRRSARQRSPLQRNRGAAILHSSLLRGDRNDRRRTVSCRRTG